MGKDHEKHFRLRVNGGLLAKFRYVCGYAGRSANSQLIQLMLKFVADYEMEHGKIDLADTRKATGRHPKRPATRRAFPFSTVCAVIPPF